MSAKPHCRVVRVYFVTLKSETNLIHRQHIRIDNTKHSKHTQTHTNTHTIELLFFFFLQQQQQQQQQQRQQNFLFFFFFFSSFTLLNTPLTTSHKERSTHLSSSFTPNLLVTLSGFYHHQHLLVERSLLSNRLTFISHFVIALYFTSLRITDTHTLTYTHTRQILKGPKSTQIFFFFFFFFFFNFLVRFL